MKKIEVQMLLYTLTKKFMEIQRYMLIHLVSYYFTKWLGDLMAKPLVWNQGTQGLFPLPIYIMWSMYICIYILHMCVNV
jgi:hypothetical protein